MEKDEERDESKKKVIYKLNEGMERGVQNMRYKKKDEEKYRVKRREGEGKGKR